MRQIALARLVFVCTKTAQNYFTEEGVIMVYSRSQIKRTAKQAISTTRPKAWLVTLVYALIVLVVAGVFQFISPSPLDPVTNVFSAPFKEAVEAATEYAQEGFSSDAIVTVFEEVFSEELEEELDDMDLSPHFDTAVAEFFAALAGQIILLSLAASLITLISQLICRVFHYGYRNYTLSVFRGQNVGIGKLFSAFPRTHIIIGSEIMIIIFTFLWHLLFNAAGTILIFLVSFLLGDLLPGGLLILLFVVIAILMAFLPYFFSLRYALTPYVILQERLGVFAGIARSKQLMSGNKWKLIFLFLSFLGWYILLGLIPAVLVIIGIVLGVLCFAAKSFGMGIVLICLFVLIAILAQIPLNLWLNAYFFTAFGGFYHTLSDNASPQGPVSTLNFPSEFPPPYGYTPPEAVVPSEPVVPPVVEFAPPAENVPSEEALLDVETPVEDEALTEEEAASAEETPAEEEAPSEEEEFVEEDAAVEETTEEQDTPVAP